MRHWLLVLVATSLLAAARRAEACDANAPEQYRSDKTVWCVNPDIWAAHQADVEKFFPYGDAVVAKLEELFAVTPNDLPYTIEAMEPNGYAMTPSHYGPGVAVTGDAFYNEFGGVVGFYGRLLVLHEFVNQWTGLVTSGWPTDWWADHRSPFPNSMDEQIMRTLGLTQEADVQHARFADTSSGDYDPEVVMFNDHFQAYGFEGLRKAFALIQGDGLHWDGLRDPPDYTDQTTFVSGNPSSLLSNYVIAYLSLGAGADVTEKFLAATVGQQPPNWGDSWESTAPDSQTATKIADAHCSIAAAREAGTDVSAAEDALRKGDYASATLAATSSCTQFCPRECGCSSDGACVAPWIPGAGPVDHGDSGGCGCQAGGAAPHVGLFWLGLLAFAGLALRRKLRS
jgi:MYXO-CTERM domain-containing protein